MVDMSESDAVVADQVLRLCSAMGDVAYMLKAPTIGGTEAADIGGVFRTVTHKVSLGLFNVVTINYEETDESKEEEGEATFVQTSTSLFAKTANVLFPNRELVVQCGDFDFYFIGLGRFLLLVLLHDGEWPKLHNSVVRYILDIPEPETYTRADVAGLGFPYVENLFSIPHFQEFTSPEDQQRCKAIINPVAELFEIDTNDYWTRAEHDTAYDVIHELRQLIVRKILRDTIMPSLAAIRNGFRMFPENRLSFTAEEIELCCGSSIQSLAEFNEKVNISDLSIQSPVLYGYFQSCLELLEPDQLEDLVTFATGNCRLPTRILFSLVNVDCCMQAHSCSNTIDLCVNRYVIGTEITQELNGTTTRVMHQGVARMYDDLLHALAAHDQFHFV
jgi:hypothetical protein